MTGDAMKWTRRICHVWLVGLGLFALGCGTQPAPTGSGVGVTGGDADNSTVLEQLSLERVNRARLKPVAEAALYGIDLNEGVPAADLISATPKQAVAINATLTQTARQHSQDMLARDYFEHSTPEGISPFQRMQAAGYLFVAAGENLAWRGTTGSLDPTQTIEQEQIDLFVDSTIPDRGHRTTMMTDVFREVGIGVLRGSFTDLGTSYDAMMQTQDYGEPASGNTFVLGVAYSDSNNNGQYDFGEGQGAIGVTLSGVTKTTNAGGGYTFEVLQAGTYTLQFAPGASTDLTITAGAPNIKVDLVNNANIVINLGLGPL
jgi:hypothetical protein